MEFIYFFPNTIIEMQSFKKNENVF